MKKENKGKIFGVTEAGGRSNQFDFEQKTDKRNNHSYYLIHPKGETTNCLYADNDSTLTNVQLCSVSDDSKFVMEIPSSQIKSISITHELDKVQKGDGLDLQVPDLVTLKNEDDKAKTITYLYNKTFYVDTSLTIQSPVRPQQTH